MREDPTSCGAIEFYPDAEDFTITDGEFNVVRGNVYLGPSLRQTPQQTPRSKGRVTYFSRAKGFTISGGNFMTIGGNLYDTRPVKVPPTSETTSKVCSAHVHNTNSSSTEVRHQRSHRQGSSLHEQQTTHNHAEIISQENPQQRKCRKEDNKITSDVHTMGQQMNIACKLTPTEELHHQNTIETNPFRRLTGSSLQNDFKDPSSGGNARRNTNPFRQRILQPIPFPVANPEIQRQALQDSPITYQSPLDGLDYTQSTLSFASEPMNIIKNTPASERA